MQQLLIVGDPGARPGALGQQLAGILDVVFKPLEIIHNVTPGQYILFDVDLNDPSLISALKHWLKRVPAHAKLIFATDKGARVQDLRANAIGATKIIHRPVDPRTLLSMLWDDVASLAADPSGPAVQQTPGMAAGIDALQQIFSSACLGAPIDSPAIQSAADAVVGQLEAEGLAAWIETVRMHHSQTYQHCLLVTGLAVSFGQKIGASHADRQRLSFAGMFHDIGKARIPLAILEKPGPLDSDEMAVMKKHPEYGLDALASAPALPPEMLDMVVHHHEYLDGSGYPHGLKGSEVSDLVRIMTIADIFGALIERRAYKAPLPGEAAYQILLDMGPKLDKDLVREFKFVAQSNRAGTR
jgi:putative nucleotidyltransferase with HDIG domain